MTMSRRGLVAGAGGLAAGLSSASGSYAKSSDFKDLQNAADKASQADGVLRLPPGDYPTRGLRIERPLRLEGIAGRTRIVSPDGGPIIVIDGGGRVELAGLILTGDKKPVPDDNKGAALVMAANLDRLVVEHCTFESTSLAALRVERCGGRIADNQFTDIGDAAIFALDSKGLAIEGNALSNIGNNGILVWASAPAEDGTLVRGNRIAKVGAKDGGSGENGNGINVYRAGNVIVAENRISDCAFSAIRNNSGNACQIVNNSCSRLGEVALYCEFAFEGAVVAGNIVEDCATGVSITNFDSGGRIAAVSNNVIRRPTATGIAAEAETAVTGNIVQGAGGAAISLGWGPYARNLVASGNVVQNCFRGIVFSVVEGAGPVTITGNRIAGCTAEALLGMDHDTPVTPDLGRAGQTVPGQNLIANNLVS